MFPFVNTETETQWRYNREARERLKSSLVFDGNAAALWQVEKQSFKRCITSPAGTWRVSSDVDILDCKHDTEKCFYL